MQNSIQSIFILCTLFTFSLFCAQNNFGEISYSLQTKDNSIRNGSGVLYFNNNSSVYIINNEKKEETKIRKTGDGSIIYPSNTIDSLANKNRFIYFNNENDLFYNNIINNNIETLLKDGTKIDWSISKIEKKILGYKCFRATGKLYGIDYTAYFTTKLKLPYGPLKINGLPGMILSVESEELELNIIAKKISFNGDENKILNDFSRKYDFAKAIQHDEYDKILLQHLNETKSTGSKKIELKDLNCKDCNSEKL